MVIIGGIMVHKGLLAFVPAVIAATCGSFVADQIFFLLGRRFRDHAFVRKAQQKPAFAKALEIFDKHPALFVFAFRFIYGLRTVSPIAIGTTRLPARTFLLVNAVAAAVWGVTFISAGYFFGHAIEKAMGRFSPSPGMVVAIVVVVAVIAGIVLLVRRRLAERGEQAGVSRTAPDAATCGPPAPAPSSLPQPEPRESRRTDRADPS
ncbi:DedA family protein [Novosphingobium sp. Leaf2]|uniref:DedA family protein n=1 Tax=Novosphingobium sp. Leaf2 TaxID=1735670 RepID=UPI001F193826|nr:DedA family protein [Novosphingobium sp. Leaf2]